MKNTSPSLSGPWKLGKAKPGRLEVPELTQWDREIKGALSNGDQSCQQFMVLIDNLYTRKACR